MTLDSLDINSILGSSDEEALEIIREMRLTRVQGAQLRRQQAEKSTIKSKSPVAPKAKDAVKNLTQREKAEMLAFLESIT